MRAGDGDSVFQPHQLREHFRARNDWNFVLMRFDNFRIFGFDRGRRDDDVRVDHIARFMTVENRRAEILQAFGNRRKLCVGTGDRVAQRQQHFGDTAHTDSADAHQMNPLEITKRHHHGYPRVPKSADPARIV